MIIWPFHTGGHHYAIPFHHLSVCRRLSGQCFPGTPWELGRGPKYCWLKSRRRE